MAQITKNLDSIGVFLRLHVAFFARFRGLHTGLDTRSTTERCVRGLGGHTLPARDVLLEQPNVVGTCDCPMPRPVRASSKRTSTRERTIPEGHGYSPAPCHVVAPVACTIVLLSKSMRLRTPSAA